jgi:hypothetical protein
VAEVIQPDVYAAWSDDELMEKIRSVLYVDEACVSGSFKSRRSAEYLDRILYTCPICGLAKQESHGDTVTCTRCGRQTRYTETKELEGVGFSSPFRFVADWYDFQNDLVNRLDLTPYYEAPLFRDSAALSEVHLYDRKELLCKSVSVTQYADRVVLNEGAENEQVFPYDEVSYVTVLGRNKVNLYFDGHVYQLKGDKRFNGAKYVNLYHRYKNLKEGKENEQFLGL